MATPKTIQSTIGFTDPSGTLVAGGHLTFQISQPSEVISGGGLVDTVPISVTLTALAVVPGGFTLWAADQLNPTGTTYRMKLTDSNNNLVADFGQVSLVGASPIDLSQLVPSSSSGGTVSYPAPVLTVPSGNQTITTGNLTLSAGDYVIASGHLFKWTDLGLSRVSAAILAFGNGTQGDTTATIQCAAGTISRSQHAVTQVQINNTDTTTSDYGTQTSLLISVGGNDVGALKSTAKNLTGVSGPALFLTTIGNYPIALGLNNTPTPSWLFDTDNGFKLVGANGAQWIYNQSTELLTLSTSGTTTDTAANLLPANSIIEAVVARVTTTITTATDWKLGDATTSGRFAAANAVMTSGSTSIGTVQADQTGAPGPRQVAAAKVRVTTTGTPGAGVIRITVFYRQFVAPTS